MLHAPMVTREEKGCPQGLGHIPNMVGDE